MNLTISSIIEQGKPKAKKWWDPCGGGKVREQGLHLSNKIEASRVKEEESNKSESSAEEGGKGGMRLAAKDSSSGQNAYKYRNIDLNKVPSPCDTDEVSVGTGGDTTNFRGVRHRPELNQTMVAKQMERVGRDLGINFNFMISVGDNFCQAGLKGPHDPKFKTRSRRCTQHGACKRNGFQCWGIITTWGTLWCKSGML